MRGLWRKHSNLRTTERTSVEAAKLSLVLSVMALVAAVALGACAPDVPLTPADDLDRTRTPLPTETATQSSTETPTATAVPTIAPGLDFTLGADWPIIDVNTAETVASLYTHAPNGVIEVLGAAGWGHLAMITADRAVLLGAQDLAPVNVAEIGDYGDLTAAAMDDRSLALAFREGGVRLYGVPSGVEMRVFDVEVILLEISDDGAMLAGGSLENKVFIWDIESGELLLELALEGIPANLTFAPDGRTLAVELEGGPFDGVELWNLEDGERLRRLEWEDRAGPTYFIRISPDWTTSAWVSRTSVLIMEMQSGEPIALLPHQDFVDETEYSPDGEMLATSSAAEINGEITGVVELWDSGSGDEVATLVNGEAAVLVAFSPDGALLAAAAYDGAIRIWDVASAELLVELDGEQEQVFRLFFAEGGRLLVSASWEGPVRFWAVEQEPAE